MTPRFIQFQVKPSAGTKVRKVQSLSEEIALELGTREARIYRSGKEINVEVPREEPEPVRLLPLCERLAFVPPTTAVLGVEENGTPLLLRMSAPDVAHVLVAGDDGLRQDGPGAHAAHVAGDVQPAQRGSAAADRPQGARLWPAAQIPARDGRRGALARGGN